MGHELRDTVRRFTIAWRQWRQVTEARTIAERLRRIATELRDAR